MLKRGGVHCNGSKFLLLLFTLPLTTANQPNANILNHGEVFGGAGHRGESSGLERTMMIDEAANQIINYAATHPQSSAGTVRNDQGCPIPSLTASLTVGQHGNVLLQDVFLVGELASFVREMTPQRVVYAKGYGAFGTFHLSKDISDLTKADFLNGIGKNTKILVRFSRASGFTGSPDLIRDCRGFSVRFYTTDGIMDIVGNTAGVMPIRDPMLFGDMSRSRKLNPQTHLADETMRWDFDSHRPETIVHTLVTFSDYGANYRVLNGYGVHAFKLVNKEGAYHYVKFHFTSEQPFRWFNSTELILVSGGSPDYATKDLFNAIANKNYPKWKVKIQVMTAEQAATYSGNPFDVTLVWNPREYPLMTIGEIVLTENPTNYFVDIEQAGFSAANLVPGIEVNPFDKMFHARLFAYPDALRYRLGVNYGLLEVNRPKFPVKNYFRDGFMRDVPNGGNSPNYFPNSFHGPTANESAMESKFHVQGVVDRYEDYNFEENFKQARLYLYHDLTAEKRGRVAENVGISLAKANKFVRENAFRNLFALISDDFAKDVWAATLQALAYQ